MLCCKSQFQFILNLQRKVMFTNKNKDAQKLVLHIPSPHRHDNQKKKSSFWFKILNAFVVVFCPSHIGYSKVFCLYLDLYFMLQTSIQYVWFPLNWDVVLLSNVMEIYLGNNVKEILSIINFIVTGSVNQNWFDKKKINIPTDMVLCKLGILCVDNVCTACFDSLVTS